MPAKSAKQTYQSPAMPADLPVGDWSDAALRVLKERYLYRFPDGSQETPEQMLWRVSRTVASAEESGGMDAAAAEQVARSFYDIMVRQEFMPNSPTLMNAGLGSKLQYSACYVLPVADSIEGIFTSIKNAAIVHQSGGGTGFSFSRLRPNGSRVKRSGGVASGPVSFMRVFDGATEAIKQGGRRRGANMGILRVDHPDIEHFITCKQDGGITNFNISVAVTDAFMQALEKDEDYALIAQPGWPAGDGQRYQGGEVIDHKNARAIFDKIVSNAWGNGDPGLVFIDRINAGPANPTPTIGQIEATNPCGEQPLLPNEACNLGSLNLAKFILHKSPNGKTFTGEDIDGRIDWARLEEVVSLCVRFLDNVISVNPFPLPEIEASVNANRRIGLGVMGWADLLYELGLPYNSEAALALAEKIMGFINAAGHRADEALAAERGPFPNWSQSIYKDGPPLRNSTVTTIAPTGSISIIAGCSSGIEPVFALAFQHIVKQPEGGERVLNFINPIFERAAQVLGFDSGEMLDKVARAGTCHDVKEVPEPVRRIFVTAHEVAPAWHVRMQAAFQKHTDNGVSKTINLPNAATEKDVADAYLLAYQSGCLGITVFRDGSKGNQVLNMGIKKEEPPAEEKAVQIKAKSRPSVLEGKTYRKNTPIGTAYITVNTNGEGQHEPFEVFVNVGKAGSDVAADAEGLGRLVSLILRLPSPLSARERVMDIVSQLRGIGSGRQRGFGKQRVLSLPHAVAQALASHIGMDQAEELPGLPEVEEEGAHITGDLCPECGQAAFVFEEGCRKCHSCGFSEC